MPFRLSCLQVMVLCVCADVPLHLIAVSCMFLCHSGVSFVVRADFACVGATRYPRASGVAAVCLGEGVLSLGRACRLKPHRRGEAIPCRAPLPVSSCRAQGGDRGGARPPPRATRHGARIARRERHGVAARRGASRGAAHGTMRDAMTWRDVALSGTCKLPRCFDKVAFRIRDKLLNCVDCPRRCL